MFLKQVLIQAMDLGKMMLISGAGVSRVEDTIERICLAYGAREVEAFTIDRTERYRKEPGSDCAPRYERKDFCFS